MTDLAGGHNHDADGAPTYPLYRDRCAVGCDDLTPVRMADTNVQHVGKDRLVTRRLVLAGPSQFRVRAEGDSPMTQPEQPLTCPTCGHPVRVVGTDEGTNHYEPVEAARPASVKPISSRWASIAAHRVGRVVDEHYRSRLAADPKGPQVHECGSYCGADIASRLRGEAEK